MNSLDSFVNFYCSSFVAKLTIVVMLSSFKAFKIALRHVASAQRQARCTGVMRLVVKHRRLTSEASRIRTAVSCPRIFLS